MEKKAINGNVAIALGIMCIVFIAGLGATIASYTAVVNSKDKTNQDYVSTHSHDNAEFNSLDTSHNSYVSTHSYTDSQYNEYVANHQHTNQDYSSALTAPKLATVDVTADDNGPNTNDPTSPLYGTSTFHVYGYIVNAGSDAAYNPKIHVVAYQLDGTKAVDGYVTLDTIYGVSWTTFDQNFIYTGRSLATWTITPQWTTNP